MQAAAAAAVTVASHRWQGGPIYHENRIDLPSTHSLLTQHNINGWRISFRPISLTLSHSRSVYIFALH